MTCIPIQDQSQVAEARRAAAEIAEQAGFSDTDAGRLAIVVTEAAANIIKHAQEGQMLVDVMEDGNARGIQVLALDRGPGMHNPAECMRDGYSSRGTAGTGLGAIMRIANIFDLHSQVGVGTALMAQLWPGRQAQNTRIAVLEAGGIAAPKPGEEISGDAWAVDAQPQRTRVIVADGLGHGVDAAEASREATRAFKQTSSYELPRALEFIGSCLRHTRGAAIAMAEIRPELGTISYIGLGNISGTITGGARDQHLVSHNGTAGHSFAKAKEFSYTIQPGAILIMHTDGLKRWDLQHYTGLQGRHPSLIAGVLYRDFNRGTDDTAVVVIKDNRGFTA